MSGRNQRILGTVLTNNYIVGDVDIVLDFRLMSSSIKQFVMLREALVNEKAAIESQKAALDSRLAEIVAALGDTVVAAPVVTSAAPAKRKAGRPAGKKKAIKEAKSESPKPAAKKKAAKKKTAKKKTATGGGRRSRSAVPLKETMLEVIGKKSLTRQEIAAGIEAAGYKSADVLNSVSATLYQNKAFKKDGKKWTLA